MDVQVLLVSVAVSTLGVFIDLFTTRLAIREWGVGAEANPWARRSFVGRGSRRWIVYEALPICGWAVLDALGPFTSLIWFSLMWGIARGLVGLTNLQTLVWYQVVGRELYQAEIELRRAFRAGNFSKQVAWKLLPAFLLAFTLLTYTSIHDVRAKSVLCGIAGYHVSTLLYD